ncbi:MAG: phosphoglycerate kinase [Alphaproteobacteria bacterium]|nr:phosphoglycerate kinase [Alphaproteobacteria bacterium]
MFKTLDDLDLAGKRVLVRGDLNVPVTDGKVTDATRIERLAPTLNELCGKGAKVIVMSHFGRPKGKIVPELSLEPVADALSAALGGKAVAFAPDCVGPVAASVVEGLEPGGVALLENLRFHPGEEANDAGFAGELAKLGDAYVNDAFSAAHRAHASTEAIARLLPAAAGRAMQAELEALTAALETPAHPVIALVGGAKVSSKLDVLGNLVSRVDAIIIGGGMANTFLNARGIDVGASLCEHDLADTVREIEARAEAAGCEILLPVDGVVAAKFEAGAPSRTVAIDAAPSDMMILDIGPDSVAELNAKLADCKTLLWNGPLGAFEIPPFDAGTVAVAREAGRLTRAGGMVSVAGGGDTVAALNHAGVADEFTYVSTAGGAFLEWLEGKTLPGVAALEK